VFDICMHASFFLATNFYKSPNYNRNTEKKKQDSKLYRNAFLPTYQSINQSVNHSINPLKDYNNENFI